MSGVLASKGTAYTSYMRLPTKFIARHTFGSTEEDYRGAGGGILQGLSDWITSLLTVKEGGKHFGYKCFIKKIIVIIIATSLSTKAVIGCIYYTELFIIPIPWFIHKIVI